MVGDFCDSDSTYSLVFAFLLCGQAENVMARPPNDF